MTLHDKDNKSNNKSNYNAYLTFNVAPQNLISPHLFSGHHESVHVVCAWRSVYRSAMTCQRVHDEMVAYHTQQPWCDTHATTLTFIALMAVFHDIHSKYSPNWEAVISNVMLSSLVCSKLNFFPVAKTRFSASQSLALTTLAMSPSQASNIVRKQCNVDLTD